MREPCVFCSDFDGYLVEPCCSSCHCDADELGVNLPSATCLWPLLDGEMCCAKLLELEKRLGVAA